MANELELVINVVGVEKALEKVLSIGAAVDRQMAEIAKRIASRHSLGLPGNTGTNTTGGPSGRKGPKRYATEDEAMAAARERMNPTNRLEERYWIRKWRRDDAAFMAEQRALQKKEREEHRIREEHRKHIVGGLGRAATYAGATIAGMTTYGYADTAEGARMANQLKVLSRELAGIFKPFQERLTRVVTGVTRYLSSLSPEAQDRFQYAGLAAGGAYLAHRSGALRAGYGAIAMMGLGRAGLYGAAAYAGINSGLEIRNVSNSRQRQGELSAGALFNDDEMQANAGLIAGYDKLPPEARRAYLRRQKSASDTRLQSHWKRNDDRTIAGMALSAAGLNPVYGTGMEDTTRELTRNRMIQRMQDDDKFQRTGVDPSNPKRRLPLDTTTVGFGGVGSTADLMQTELLRTGASSINADNDKADDEAAKRTAEATEKMSTTLDLVAAYFKFLLNPGATVLQLPKLLG